MAEPRKSPLLPEEDAREAALFFVVAALCFLAALTALATRAAYGAAETWAGQIQGEMSIRLIDGRSSDADRLAESLRTLDGVLSVTVEDRKDTEALLEPWLGSDLPDDLPVPAYITLKTDKDAENLTERIKTQADDQGIAIAIEVFELWAEDVERSLGVMRLAGLIALGLLVTIVISVIAFATHAALLARRDVVNVLHTCGASDRFIARLFEFRFFGLGLKAGMIGAMFALLGALLLFFTARQSGDRSWLLPQMQPDIGTFIVLLITPLVSAAVSMFAARLTVTRALAELS